MNPLSSRRPEYIAEIERMRAKAAEWRKANPKRTAAVQFNYPSTVEVIGTLQDMLDIGALTVNEPGLELLKFMCDLNSATPNMLRLALES